MKSDSAGDKTQQQNQSRWQRDCAALLYNKVEDINK